MSAFIAVTDSMTNQRVIVNVAQIHYMRVQGGNTLLDLGQGSFVECQESLTEVSRLITKAVEAAGVIR